MWLRQTVEALRQSTLLQLRSRMVGALAALAVLYAVLAWFLAHRVCEKVPGDDLYGILTYLVIVQFALPMGVTYLGLAAIHGELSDRTATYLFVRPLRRSSLLIGKWLATALIAATLASFACMLLYVALAVPERPWRRNLGPQPWAMWTFVRSVWLACPAYAAVGVLFGAAFKRPLLCAVVFVLGWEGIASNLPPEAGIRSATVADPVRRWLLIELEPRRHGLRDLLTGALEGFDLAVFGDPIRPLIVFTAVALGLALFIYGRREYESKPRD